MCYAESSLVLLRGRVTLAGLEGDAQVTYKVSVTLCICSLSKVT